MSDTRASTPASGEPTLRDDAAAVVRWTVLGAVAGAAAGLVVGGVGGRLAMFVLRLTSSDRLIGLRTDDGFRIGEITFETGFLLSLTAGVGLVFGVLYVAARPFLPPRWRVAGWTIAGAVVGGAVIVHGDGVDFTVLEPTGLAVAMFVAIPAAGAAATAMLVERRTAWWRRRRPPVIALVPVVLGLPLALPGVALVVLGGVLVLALGRVAAVRQAAVSPRAPAVGALVLLAVVAVGGVALANDLRDVLG